MKNLAFAIVVSVVMFAVCDAETVTNVRGSQRPNSNIVDIYYDLDAVDGWSYTVNVRVLGRTNAVTATTFSGDVGKGIAPGKNRHIVWEAGTDWRGKKGDVRATVTATAEARGGKPQKVQLWEGGPYWADRNIGADAPYEYGLYFWWGDTKGHRPLGTTFSFSFEQSNCSTYQKTTDQLRSEGWITSNDVLAPGHDPAHVHWGGSWRMPTYQELYALWFNKCDWTWTTMNGVNGYVVRGRGSYASNSIFLPAAGRGSLTSLSSAGSGGYYYQSVPFASMGYYGMFYGSHNFTFDSRYRNVTEYGGRTDGLPVRPVQ